MTSEIELLARAAEMRRNPTEWEKRLWRELSGTKLGHKFRRQHVIAPYIADFFCPAKGLIVEIDGDTHDPAKDAARDRFIASKGFHTLRFSNLDVRENMEGVLLVIVNALQTRPNRWSGVPHPNPVAGERCPASFRSCRGHDRPATPEGEGLER